MKRFMSLANSFQRMNSLFPSNHP